MYLRQKLLDTHSTDARREELATVFLQRLALDATLVTRKKSSDTELELFDECAADMDLFNLIISCKCLWLCSWSRENICT